MVTHTILATAMCHHWEEVPIREEREADAPDDEPDDVTKEVAPA